MNLGFVVVYVSDMEKMKAFYTELLGMTVVEEVSSPTFQTLRPAAGSLVALQDKAAAKFAPASAEGSGNVELSFEVDDVDATWQRWQEAGVAMESHPMDLPFGRYFLAKDPEGHYLSVYRFKQDAPTPPNTAAAKG